MREDYRHRQRQLFMPVLLGLVQYVMSDRVLVTCDPPCPPTATCVNAGLYTYCDCPEGKTGLNCTLDDPCLPQTENCPMGKHCEGPCDPNRVCIGVTGEPHCTTCIAGWQGDNCDEDIDECTEVGDNLCQHGGTCINEIGDFRCACTEGWLGKECMCQKGNPCEDDIEPTLITPSRDNTENYSLPDNGQTVNTSTIPTCFVALMSTLLINYCA